MYPGSLFYNSIKNKTFDSAIFFGPSGTGKTTLARIIAREMDGKFYEIKTVEPAPPPGLQAVRQNSLPLFCNSLMLSPALRLTSLSQSSTNATSHGSSTHWMTAANLSPLSSTAVFTRSVTTDSRSVTICSEKLSDLR